MKAKQFSIFLAIILIAGASAFVVALRVWPAQSEKNLESVLSAERLSCKLGLAPKQKEQLAELHAGYLNRLKELDNRHCGACCKVGSVIFEQGQPEESITTYLDEMAYSQKESELATIRYMQKVHAILEPGQKKIFEDMVKACICRCGPESGCRGECGKK